MDFTKELAHELQAPLTSLELRLLKLHEELPNNEQAKDCLREIDALKRLVTSFLELDAPELEVREHALTPLLDVVEERFLPLADARNVKLHMDAGAASALCDARATERILTNLVDNAIKFSTATVKIQVRARNGNVELEVRDDGIGISSETRPHVFEPFYRVDREAPGSGLGLAISKRLAEAQRGSLRCESELGRGSSFILTLPAT